MVSRRLPTAAARDRPQARSCGIRGGQSGTGRGFLRVLRFPLLILIPPNAPYSSGAGTTVQIVTDVPTELSLTPPHEFSLHNLRTNLSASYPKFSIMCTYVFAKLQNKVWPTRVDLIAERPMTYPCHLRINGILALSSSWRHAVKNSNYIWLIIYLFLFDSSYGHFEWAVMCMCSSWIPPQYHDVQGKERKRRRRRRIFELILKFVI
jgi:hypothetical protein